MTIDQLNYFIESLNDTRPSFRKFLLDLQHQQQEQLFRLEQEYLNLVRDRRTALVTFLKSETASKRQMVDELKEMHSRTQAELDAFLKVRVYDGWLEAQMAKQIEALKGVTGFPTSLLVQDRNPKYLQSIMAYLLTNI